ncbi:hypothetical protein BN1095_4900001 [Clostridioides difficile]|uniref:Uncharacterized protein n=1 Tax=Clostridioides difficile TaxID=1496 RepID=A0A069AYA0_CLODI|nr:hypothetical protein BN1095_4900001 [Clostridioides difficile]
MGTRQYAGAYTDGGRAGRIGCATCFVPPVPRNAAARVRAGNV